ncbi:P-loop containing nucleoside triphosphate hydrolase protein [Rhizodiscina lignyota]|uniref:P-loop containing nucleoside triphosphate hydrolase protein n=1 Tax=Rhizodiscina lignyota TaxID=1504668 RepID=A0A9P4M6G1_9PEZI|nr:P-loop containing nucleoside triphosphate hydrolase protein [Rhizodiscina lignyota]
MPQIIDDKSEHCIPFILECLEEHRRKYDGGEEVPPFFLGLNGVQGAGKTTLVSTLHNTLTTSYPLITTAIVSIDDFYLTHEDQVALAKSNPTNPILQHRGQPSTHDIPLLVSTFASLRDGKPSKIPVYDKSAFSGQGDRAPESTWTSVNEGQEKVQVVVLEGWCVGFRPVSDEALEEKWKRAVAEEKKGSYDGQLGKLKFEDIKTVNDALKKYDEVTDMFDAFIHIDAEDTHYVYDWRLQQEAALRQSKGSGMTDEQVIHFVNGYYPAYEIYTDVLRSGVVKDAKGRQLRLVVGKDRRVKEVHKI